MKLGRIAAAAGSVLLAAACRREAPAAAHGSTAAAEAEVRARSRGVADAEARKDALAVMPFWSEDAVVHFNGEAAIHGKAAIQKMYMERLPRLDTFRAYTDSVQVAPGGDLAWETGSTAVTLPNATGPPSTSKFLIVWKKEADGKWRIAACALTANPKAAS
jgi:uncharacterized protein (TIGR02246 family)